MSKHARLAVIVSALISAIVLSWHSNLRAAVFFVRQRAMR